MSSEQEAAAAFTQAIEDIVMWDRGSHHPWEGTAAIDAEDLIALVECAWGACPADREELLRRIGAPR